MTPKTHVFRGMTTREVYARTQCDDAISDGDVLVVHANATETHRGIVGIMVEAWPLCIVGGNEDGTDHEFHRVDHLGDFLDHAPEYRTSVEIAQLSRHLS